MIVTKKSIQQIIENLDTNDAIDNNNWTVEDTGGKIVASNVYHLIDRHGLFDTNEPFYIEWDLDKDLTIFSVRFDQDREIGLSGLRGYLDSLVIDQILDIDTLL